MIVHIAPCGKEMPIRGPYTSIEKACLALEEYLRNSKQLSDEVMRMMTSGPSPNLEYYKESERKSGNYWHNLENWVVKEM